MIDLKNKKIYNELAKNTLSEILENETNYDSREIEIEFRAKNLIQFWKMIGTQENTNMQVMMSLARKNNSTTQEVIKWMGKGVMILKEIKEKLSKVLDNNQEKNLTKKLSCKLKVFEWQYIAYICHLYIDQLSNTKSDHRKIKNMFFITEKIANEISQLPSGVLINKEIKN